MWLFAPDNNYPKGRYLATGLTYDITLEDQRFLMIKESADQATANHLHIVLNWSEELKRLVTYTE